MMKWDKPVIIIKKKATKELILCHKIRFSNPFIFAIKRRLDLRYFKL